ncbi:hypothetical protein DDB_G0279517 [Dictyostelium discoideum AX4]|uniref:Uncharacterized protein n=1 Tax=Dictyostelium discoideum TaxID=44689 RepID=Q54WP4_DICDI|nr:hypothetical protein DDB_G0279517 [Dictyostelium discoideum AX4]EAL67697.1 hypothetical protein DDB_G0279517 [Dictyostelium discoideum AX4]|eukprot:XP_641673.1 hypothetical protein DDB_G0279517 [Dictyostelium discoideum AX4]
MSYQIQYLINIIIIISISIIFIYLSINNENSILGSILNIYNNNDFYDNLNNYENQLIQSSINFENIKKTSIYKNYPYRYKHLEEKQELLKQKIKEERLKLIENEKSIPQQQKLFIIIFISFLTITIIAFFVKLIIKNNLKETKKTTYNINKQIETIDKSINNIIINKPLIEINKMKSINNPFLLEILLQDFNNSYTTKNNKNDNNPILLEYKKEIEELNKKQEILNNNFKNSIENMNLLENSESVNENNNNNTNNNNNNNENNNNNNNNYNNDNSDNEENFKNENRKVNKDLKRASIEIQTKMFMYEYKKWDKQRIDAIEEAERIRKENEKEKIENEKRKLEEEKKKKEYQESLEQVRESKFFIISIKIIVILNILPELVKLIMYHINSIIPTIMCFNINNSNYYLKFLKQILNNTPFSNLLECIPIIKINWFLTLMTIAYIGILIISLTLHSNSFIITLPLLAITFYTYKIDYNNLNSYLVHIIMNLVLLFLWKLFIHNYQERIISSKFHKTFISPSITIRIFTIIIIIIYNIIIHKYFLNSINLIITK